MTDSRARLRALAHPLRSRLVARLRAGGPATATDLAADLGTNSGATSYHLRALEAAGVVRDSGTGTGRRRVWEIVEAGPDPRPELAVGDLEDDDAQAGLDWLERDYVDHFTEQATQWLDHAPDWPQRWQLATGVHDWMVLATDEQLQSMRAEIDEVVKRYRRVGQGNPTARRLAVYSFVFPLDMDRAPRG
ncbi:ArsR/SmtB family transcription factor [Kribbia dieselivorans]|uniref:ArsR/SmtB family transcription factor n=1 Tax=Kribbia dieselivorans TaxID=331526 RepID=UPI000837E8E8|nr:helix-turn-helix domain-containing protein [Kribbia dieselivorans]